MDAEILGYQVTLPVSKYEINDVITRDELSQSGVSVYLRYLDREMLIPKNNTERFVFLCQDKTALYSHISGQKEYIADRLAALARPGVDTLFLAPVNIVGYWVLLAINPNEDTVYYMDPAHADFKDRKFLMTTFNDALTIYRGCSRGAKSRSSKSSKTKWIFVECACQYNNIDCGYYVLRFLKDIITHNQIQIPSSYFPDSKYHTYTDDQIFEMLDEWCNYVIMNQK